ncbi:hypothetical protein [Pseudomonas sp. AU12215]|uniref:hypothetical protein n=1 Tax=Pseudomonas sp. AU12215 TaxID=1860123 RepID=UPI0007EE8435|nr:hypothetical protein [Pseudomonas sp. AU12215]OBY57749.1 hypothetical protein A9513_005870 [Pseudomonas sp. AU12215]
MVWIVKMTGDDGVYYGTSPDTEGIRYRTAKPENAEQFESKQKAESVFYWFHQMRELQKYKLEAVEL